MRNRRQFISQFSKTTALAAAALGLPLLNMSCATIDDILIHDPLNLNKDYIIIGGGIGGLFAAHQLKKRKIPYQIFEASSRLGGKLLSDKTTEWGAFEFSKTDKVLLSLVKELKLEKERIDSEAWTLSPFEGRAGSQILIDRLTRSVQGLFSAKQIRLGHVLKSCEFVDGGWKLNFQNSQGFKSYSTKNIIFTVPMLSLEKIKGLAGNSVWTELDDTLKQFQNTNKKYIVRVILPANSQSYILKSHLNSAKFNGKIMTQIDDNTSLSLRWYKNKYYFTFYSSPEAPFREIEKIENYLSRNFFQGQKSKMNLTNEHVYDWSLQAMKNIDEITQKPKTLFRNKDSSILLVNDCVGYPYHRVESVLKQISDQIDSLV